MLKKVTIQTFEFIDHMVRESKGFSGALYVTGIWRMQ